ncbi:hypothetical protein MACH09_27710 [Vibrio sp. MACH09]|uniref:STAS/SEC14 domain-containing protein n=1 Tax=Vibrio sp. MACH09 TaxID=3025122 RepID=UPI002790767C|nr:STAS/SEC14 domain-containing protein [Vibrio sp. MACH09]GLO62263.1 hypothetical protein MACH09_27710 [Vibrio sp. MACH09]
MIKQLIESEGATIGLEISGKIDSQQENQWIEKLDNLIQEQGAINVLIVLNGKFSMDANVVYKDLKWTFSNLKNINKLAIVSDSKLIGLLVAADSPFGKLVGIDEKHFEISKLNDAWRWIKE